MPDIMLDKVPNKQHLIEKSTLEVGDWICL